MNGMGQIVQSSNIPQCPYNIYNKTLLLLEIELSFLLIIVRCDPLKEKDSTIAGLIEILQIIGYCYSYAASLVLDIIILH